MKKSILTVYLVMLSLVVFSQQMKAQQGANFQLGKNYSIHNVIGTDNSGTYVLQSKTQGFSVGYLLAHLDNSLNVTKQVPLVVKNNKDELDFLSCFHVGGKLYLFTTYRDKKRNKKLLYSQTVNKTTLIPNSDLKLITEVDFFSYFNGGAFNVQPSPDKSKLLIVKDFPWNKDANRKYEFFVKDADLNMVWQKEVTIPYNSEKLKYFFNSVSNQGLVAVYGQFGEESLNSYKVFTCSKDGLTGDYDVKVEGKNITGINLQFSEEGQILCAGLYNSNSKSYDSEGSYFAKIDPTSKKVIRNNKNFSAEFVAKYVTSKREQAINKKEEKGKELALYDYKQIEMIVKKDGGSYLICENQYDTRTAESMHFYFNDIIVISYNKDGAIEWYENIPKRQFTFDTYIYSSYIVAHNVDGLKFFFNDNSENINIWTTGKLKNFTNKDAACVTMVSIGKDGKQVRKVMEKTIVTPLVQPRESKQLNSKEVLFYHNKDKDHRFTKLMLE